jgi:hypothetical protein
VVNPWMFLALFLACCLVAGFMGYVTASLRLTELAMRVASMEAAVAAYWDRIRKRMRVEEAPKVRAVEDMTDAEILELGRRHGLLGDVRERG